MARETKRNPPEKQRWIETREGLQRVLTAIAKFANDASEKIVELDDEDIDGILRYYGISLVSALTLTEQLNEFVSERVDEDPDDQLSRLTDR